MTTPAWQTELRTLIETHLEHELSGEERRRLNELLQDNRDSRRYYLTSCYTHHALAFRAIDPELQSSTFASVLDGDRGKAVGSGQEAGGGKAEGGKRKAEEATTQYSVLSTRYSPLRTWERALWRHRLGVGVAAGAFFVAALLGWAAMTYLPGVAKNEEPQEETPVAEWIALLNDQHNVEWLDDTKPAPNRPRLVPGQRLAISTGLLEINYRTGAKVIIEGPAEFVVGGTEGEGTEAEGTEALSKKIARSSVPQSSILNPQSSPANSGYLALGKLTARVEGEKAKGFAIDTPAARIEDLGTEFGVFVDTYQDATVHVFEGAVDLVSEKDGIHGRATRTRLVANETAQVKSSTGAVASFEGENPQFIRQLTRPAWRDVQIVNSSFESPRLVLQNNWRQDITGWKNPQNSAGVSTLGARFSSGTPHERQVAYLNAGFVLQELNETLQPGATYRLTMWVGNIPGPLDPDYTIELRAGDTVLVTQRNPVEPGNGEFRKLELTYECAASSKAVGQPLTIVLRANGTKKENQRQTFLDDIRLVVREAPSTQ